MRSQEERRHGNSLLEFEGRKYMNDVDRSRANQTAALEAVSEDHTGKISSENRLQGKV